MEKPQNPENRPPKPVEGEDLKNPEKIKQAHVESVASGASWPTREGINDPEIQAALMKYFESLTESEADIFAGRLEKLQREMINGQEPGFTTKVMDSLKASRIPLFGGGAAASIVNPAVGLTMIGLALASYIRLPESMRAPNEKKRARLENAYDHLIEMQELLSKAKNDEFLHPDNQI